MAEKGHKEFCSACKQYYEISDGIWIPCPFCDGAGHLLAEDERENILADSNGLFIPLRNRWDLKLR